MMLRTGKMRRRVPSNAFTPLEIRNHRHKKRLPKGNLSLTGFTLIELAIVASLIVVLIAVSTPLFRTTYRALELKDSAYNIAKMIRYAAASAVMEEKRYKIVFDFERRSYWLLKESEKGSGKEFEKVQGRFGSKFYLPEDISLSSDKNELIFLPNGRSTKATVSVMDKMKKKGFDINATGKTGQVEIVNAKEK